LDTPFVAARTPIEKILSTIWSEVLHVEDISLHDNFLELRGDSLLATQVISRVIEQFAVRMPARTLLEAPTVEQMAMMIIQHLVENMEANALG
jgi:acyl carrier protein